MYVVSTIIGFIAFLVSIYSVRKNKMDKFFVPISMAIMAYVVFLIFGPAEDKIQLAIITPIVSVIWFFGVFGVIYFQDPENRYL